MFRVNTEHHPPKKYGVGGVERIKISQPQNPEFRGLSEAPRQGIIDEEKRVFLSKRRKKRRLKCL
jgi:hypothetical protein